MILAANRDEFFNRPTLYADFWSDNKLILGGRDVQSQGTWLGVNKKGRFIAITNYRDPKIENPQAKSRGELSKNFLSQNQSIPNFLASVSNNKLEYNGFNLMLSDDGFNSLYHYSNISDKITKIINGIHGLSNHLLDTPWPKVVSAKEQLIKIVKSDSIDVYKIIEMLKDGNIAPSHMLPKTGISYDLEKVLSPIFISLEGYGTRCSTVILVDHSNNVTFLEVSFNEKQEVMKEKKYSFQLSIE